MFRQQVLPKEQAYPLARQAGEPDIPLVQQHLRQLSPQLLIGSLLVIMVTLVALFAPLLTHFSAEKLMSGPRLAAPDAVHWLGTDAFGRDLWSRLLFGARLTLAMAATATLISAVPGILLGLLAGYYTGWPDRLISRMVDVLLSLPGLLLAIVLIARMGPSLLTTAFALGITGIPTFYRVIRSEVLSTGQCQYIQASHALGSNGLRILVVHILPHVLPNIIVLLSLRVGTFLLAGSGLSFIGLGAQPPTPEWGVLLADGKANFQTAWWLWVFPSLAIVLTVMGFNALGDGLRDRLDIYRIKRR